MNKKLFLSTCYIVALGLFSAESLATLLPKGTDYPVTHLYKGSRSVQVDRSDEFTNSFRTRFKDAMQGPVFLPESMRKPNGDAADPVVTPSHLLMYVQGGHCQLHSLLMMQAMRSQKL